MLLQWLLIVQARALAGAPAFLLLPLRTMIPLGPAVNAPVGLMTGLLFPLVCRWVREGGARAPVAQAADILVIGSGLGLCQAFLTLDSVRQVTWAQGDSDYMRQISRLTPPDLRIADRRLRRLEGDVRERLAALFAPAAPRGAEVVDLR